VAYRIHHGNDRVELVIDDGAPIQAEWVFCPTFSPDGKRLAVGLKRRRKWLMWIDGKLHGPYGSLISSEPRFSADSKHVVYAAVLDNGERRVHIDGRPGPNWRGGTWSPWISANGKTVAYRIGLNHKQAVVVNGKPGAAYAWVSEPVVSADGAVVAYRTNRGGRFTGRLPVPAGGKWWVVVNGIEEGPYDRVSEALAVTADGRVVYGATIGREQWLVTGRSRKSIAGTIAQIAVGPRAKELAVVRLDRNQAFVDHRGLTWGPYSGTSGYAPPRFARNGALAYGIGATGRQAVVFAGVKGPDFDQVWLRRHHVSPRGDRVLYNANRNRSRWLVVQTRSGTTRLIENGADGWFSPDGSHFVYVVEERNQQKSIMVGQQRLGPFLWVAPRPQFSRDGTKVGIGVRDGTALWWKVLNLGDRIL
jgi:hypothetical protein